MVCLENTVKHVFFRARLFFAIFTVEFHLRKIHDSKNFNFDYFYSFRPFSCILGVFRVFGVFCRFSLIHEKYTLAKILVDHSRTIDAREIYSVACYENSFFSERGRFHNECRRQR